MSGTPPKLILMTRTPPLIIKMTWTPPIFIPYFGVASIASNFEAIPNSISCICMYSYPPYPYTIIILEYFFINIKIRVSDQFPSIKAAREAIKRFVINEGESFSYARSDKSQYIVVCKDAILSNYKFCIRASKSAKDIVLIMQSELASFGITVT